MTKKISQLPAATSVDTNDEFVINQDGTTKKLTTANNWEFGGDVNFDSGTLFVDASTDRVGIGTTSPNARLEASKAHDTSFLAGVVASPQLVLSNPENFGYPTGMLFKAPLVNGGALTNNAAIYSDWTSNNNAHLAFATTGSGTLAERMRIDSSGNVSLNSGNLILSNGAGIDFSAHPNAAGMTSELLDDYETGTWTPVVTGWSSVTYDTQNGNYTKIGNQITAWFALRFSGTSTGANVTITGLPFTVGATHGGALTYYDAPINETTGVLLYPSTTQITFYADNDSGSLIQSNGNASLDFLIGSVTYQV